MWILILCRGAVQNFQVEGFRGTVSFITSMTDHFCSGTLAPTFSSFSTSRFIFLVSFRIMRSLFEELVFEHVKILVMVQPLILQRFTMFLMNERLCPNRPNRLVHSPRAKLLQSFCKGAMPSIQNKAVAAYQYALYYVTSKARSGPF